MPPKTKVSKEEILSAAVELVRQNGENALNARNIARSLGCSTQPIFSNFIGMDELRAAVKERANILYQNYLAADMTAGKYPPYKASGMAYIRFAKEEPELYKMLFINPDKKGESMLETLSGIRLIVINSIEKTYRFNEKESKRLFRDLWLVAHSISTLCVGGICPYSDEEIAKILTSFSVSICKSIKEIKGFVDDNFDRDGVFGKIIEE